MRLEKNKAKPKSEEKVEQENTYVKRLLQHDPTGLGLDLKVFQIVRTVRSTQGVHDGTIVVGIFVGSGNAQNVRSDARILFDVFDVFLKGQKPKLSHHSPLNPQIPQLTCRSNNGGLSFTSVISTVKEQTPSRLGSP